MIRREPLIGTAGWSIRSEYREAFPGEGPHLERYAARFNAVEINSSFYRPHRRATYERWAGLVGQDFRFSVKLPKAISHVRHAGGHVPEILRFAEEVAGLGDKLGIVLIQFPPSLAYDEARAVRLFGAVRASLPCDLACEPRHASWFEDDADALLGRLHIARVAADPAVVTRAAVPGGWLGIRYRRLHGSPRTYYSNYEPTTLDSIRADLAMEVAAGLESWCIFDNTAIGFAVPNALELRAGLGRVSGEPPIDRNN